MDIKNNIATRHPKVILVCDDINEVSGAIAVIIEQVEDFRTVQYGDEAITAIKEFQPYVLFIALPDIKRSVQFYTDVVNDNLLTVQHEAILLCQNKESGAAFHCCVKGLFSDYFVIKPMYENYRLKMIIHSALLRCAKPEGYNGLKETQFGHISDGLKEVINTAATAKQQAHKAIEHAKSEINKLQNQTVDPQLSKEEMLKVLTSDHITPLLNELEEGIKSGFEVISKKLQSQQQRATGASAPLSKVSQSESITQQGEDPEQPSPPPQSNSPDSPKQILVVEDNDVYREMIRRLLADQAFTVDTAISGLQAIKKIQNKQYDLIFMDLFMPELNGLKTTSRIRAIKDNENVPIVALTGNKNKKVIRKWANHGLQGYLIKPSTKAEIMKVVEKLLGGGQRKSAE